MLNLHISRQIHHPALGHLTRSGVLAELGALLVTHIIELTHPDGGRIHAGHALLQQVVPSLVRHEGLLLSTINSYMLPNAMTGRTDWWR